MRDLSVVGALAMMAACNTNTPTYFAPMAGAIQAGTGEGMEQGQGEVVIPFRRPNADERKQLAAESRALGFDVPWLRRDKIAVSVQFKITSLSDEPGVARILVNGANEMFEYDAVAIAGAIQMATMDNEAPTVFSLYEGKPLPIAARGTYSGTVREDDFEEAALDLDAIGRWMATPTAVLINRSDVNPVDLQMMPPKVVIPAMFKIRITFTATKPMRCEYLVRVRDQDNRLAGGDDEVFAPKPMVYLPAGAVPPGADGGVAADAGI